MQCDNICRLQKVTASVKRVAKKMGMGVTAYSSVPTTGSVGVGDRQQRPVNAAGSTGVLASNADALAPLATLCAIARFHQVAADVATLAYQLGVSSSDTLTSSDLLRAARHLGFRAKLSSATIERLGLTPLPALALIFGGLVRKHHWRCG